VAHSGFSRFAAAAGEIRGDPVGDGDLASVMARGADLGRFEQ
jgi:hypothetical protein